MNPYSGVFLNYYYIKKHRTINDITKTRLSLPNNMGCRLAY